MRIAFDKMEGAGNDFVLIDNRSNAIPPEARSALAVSYCRRQQGIGADGMVFIQNDDTYNFAWDFYNPDGSVAEMCGNGARCAARFANKIGAAGTEMVFRTLAGPIRAELTPAGARVGLSDVDMSAGPETLSLHDREWQFWFLNTGVPHAVFPVDDLDNLDVFSLGRELRNHPRFAPAGTNVNFFTPGNGNRMRIRTYERGVEDETLACGTGTTAASLVAGKFLGLTSPITTQTRSGEELIVYFTFSGTHALGVQLEGGARLVFSGEFEHPL